MTQSRRLQLRKRPEVHVAVVVPAYNVATELGDVLRQIPAMVKTIVVVNDASRDDTGAVAERYAQLDSRLIVKHHDVNRGVGGAVITGFETALEAGADVVVKVDGDGQMPLWLMPQLIQPLVDGKADYTKGNRFRDFQAVRAMPFVRRFGNVVLSFFAKAATGYWHCFDPTNGFVAIRADVLSQLPLKKIDKTYFFETSMLGHLYVLGAVVKEVPMPARYAGETSSLSIGRVVRQFPGKLLGLLLRRLALKNFVYDFTVESFQILCGLPLLLAGMIYGGYHWWWYKSRDLAAPTGTVVLSAMMIMIGMQLLISAVNLDLQGIPREPINAGPLSPIEAEESQRQTAGPSLQTPPT
jgi:dolichol-phosphate mannosyltransferase